MPHIAEGAGAYSANGAEAPMESRDGMKSSLVIGVVVAACLVVTGAFVVDKATLWFFW